jgi:hypothetical protein
MCGIKRPAFFISFHVHPTRNCQELDAAAFSVFPLSFDWCQTSTPDAISRCFRERAAPVVSGQLGTKGRSPNRSGSAQDFMSDKGRVRIGWVRFVFISKVRLNGRGYVD